MPTIPSDQPSDVPSASPTYENNCFMDRTGSGEKGCECGSCEATICAADPYCCETEWDNLCSGAALQQCQLDHCPSEQPSVPTSDAPTASPVAAPNNCYVDRGGTGEKGCECAACEAVICAADPYCCEVNWDSLCSGAAPQLCSTECPSDQPSDQPSEAPSAFPTSPPTLEKDGGPSPAPSSAPTGNAGFGIVDDGRQSRNSSSGKGDSSKAAKIATPAALLVAAALVVAFVVARRRRAASADSTDSSVSSGSLDTP
jgi:hypothetical protein